MKTSKIILMITVICLFIANAVFAGDTLNYILNKDTTIKAAIITNYRDKKSAIQNNSINAYVERPSVIHITITGNYLKVTVILYDLLGKEVQKLTSVNLPEYSWNLRDNLKGIYLLKVQTDNASYVKKIVLQ